MRLLDELKERELLFDVTDPKLADLLETEKFTFYLGIDPTGSSLHVGHLVTLLVAKRLEQRGHKPLILIGGATGLIGDPKMQGERKMLSLEDSLLNADSIRKQVNTYFNFKELVNNYDWISKINVIEFLRDYGKNFNVNQMIAKDIVKSRLDSGISYTEFSYQILQSLDWLHLYEHHDCQMQIGGQDQWGNMVAGIDLIRKKTTKTDAYAFTIPLITKLDGTKFGKTEGGESVWLDPKRTSAYKFYQFWFNTSDEEVIKRLKQYTFLTLDEIKEIEQKWEGEKHLRLAQKTLAENLTELIHGKKGLEEAILISEKLFKEEYQDLTKDQLIDVFKTFATKPYEENIALVDALILTDLAKSKREAREFIGNSAVSVNGKKVTDLEYKITASDLLQETLVVLKRGKKNFGILTNF